MEFDIYGTWVVGKYTAIDVMLVPCASNVTAYDGSMIGDAEDCVWDE